MKKRCIHTHIMTSPFLLIFLLRNTQVHANKAEKKEKLHLGANPFFHSVRTLWIFLTIWELSFIKKNNQVHAYKAVKRKQPHLGAHKHIPTYIFNSNRHLLFQNNKAFQKNKNLTQFIITSFPFILKNLFILLFIFDFTSSATSLCIYLSVNFFIDVRHYKKLISFCLSQIWHNSFYIFT